MLRASKLVDELIQGVDRQLPTQRPNLGQQVLFQPLHPLQDAGTMRVSLWGAQGACGTGGQGLPAIWAAHSPTPSGTQPWALQHEEGPASSRYRCREVRECRHSPSPQTIPVSPALPPTDPLS